MIKDLKIRLSLLLLQIMFIVNGISLVLVGLSSTRIDFTLTRIYVAFGVILINIAVILSFLHRRRERTRNLIQQKFNRLQVSCPLCNKLNFIETSYCHVCGNKLETKRRET